jgi:hypothetical protein
VSDTLWKYFVEGSFEQGGRPVTPCHAIVESGVREEGSPFNLDGVGPGAKADAKGNFRTWFVTDGASTPVRNPQCVSVFVRVAPGSWEPVVVKVGESNAVVLSDREMKLSLGRVVLPDGVKTYVPAA